MDENKDLKQENKDLKEDLKNNRVPLKDKKEKPEKVKRAKPERKKLNKSGGCLGCFTGIIATILCSIAIVLVGGFFLLDRFLAVNYDMTVAECFTLLTSTWSVNENKVITEGKATDEDREEFYSTLADSLFLKDDAVEGVVDSAIDEFVIPVVTDAIASQDKGASTIPALFGEGEGSKNGFEEYIKQLLDEGVIDKAKLEAYFANELPAEDKYSDYFVLDLKGKGMVSTIDYVVNRVLTANPETANLANTFGIRQIKFTSNADYKQINLVLDVKIQKMVIGFMESPLFEQYITDSAILENKALIRQFLGMLPSQILITVDLNICDTVTVDLRLNNLTVKQVDKWLNFIKDMSGMDVKAVLNEEATKYYNDIKNAVIKYVDIEEIIGNGCLNVDAFNIVSVVLNEQLGLEGENLLNKVEASTTVTNVLYANMDVNGNGIEKIIQEDAPAFAGNNWKDEAENDFLEWLATNVAFDKKHTLDEVVQKFKNETGKFVVPSEFTSFLEFIDANYLRQGTAFLKNGITFDDRFVAYLFEDYKQDIFDTAGYGNLAPVLTLQYVSITQEIHDGVAHNYLSLGLSAKTKELCSALGYGDFDFIASFVGDELFLCATADVTLDKALERTSTRLRVNGLTVKQTLEVFSTVKKLTGYDVIGDLVDKNVDKFVDMLLDYADNKFTLGFEIKTNPDGSTTGMVILPSVTEILQEVLKETGNDKLDAEAIIDSVGKFLTSSPSTADYNSSLADTSLTLTGKVDSFASYEEVVSKALFGKYFLDEDTKLEDVFSILMRAIKEEEGALDELIGTDGNDGLIKIRSAYFEQNTTLKSTRPVIDGHVLAYIINTCKDDLNDLLGDDVARFIEIVDVKDVTIGDGYLGVTVGSTPAKLLALEEMSSLDSFVKNFIYNIFGGENANITVTVKVNVGDNAEKIKIYVQDMSEDEMQDIFDLLEAFGITIFDFSNENNEFVKIADQVAGYIKEYATIEDNIASLPSVFGLINQMMQNEELTEEAMFNAVRAIMVSTADTSDYNDVLADANEILTGDSDSGYSYSELVSTYAEKKYLIKDGKDIGDALTIVANGSDDMLDQLIGEEDGIVEFTRESLKNYFTSIAPSLNESNPTLDTHSLAFVIDTYKSDLASMMGLDEETSKLLDLVKIADTTVNDNVLTVRIVLNVQEVVSALMKEGEVDVNRFFNILEEGKSTLSVSLSVSLGGDDSISLIVNDISKQDFDSINALLKAFDITYLDFESEGNPLREVIVEVKSLVNEYMPYDSENRVFKIKSLFDFIAENVEFNGNSITALDGYTLIGSFATYDDGCVVEEDYSSINHEANLNALTLRYYAIDNGVELIQKAKSGEISVDDIEIKADVIKNGSGDYKKSFVYGEENVVPFIESMGVELGEEGFTLNRVDVLDTNVLNINVIIEVSSFIGEDLEMIASALPTRISATIAVSFSGENDDWTIDGMQNFNESISVLKTMGVDLNAIVNDARNSIVSEGSIKQLLDEYEIAFVNGEESGIQFPALTKLYTKIDDTFTEDEVEILVDEIVCYDEANAKARDYTSSTFVTEIESDVLKHYAMKNGYDVIKALTKSTLAIDDITFDKTYLNSERNYVKEFVIKEENLVPFLDDLSLSGISQGYKLNYLAVVGENKIEMEIIVDTVTLMGNSDELGSLKDLMPEKLAVVMPVDLNKNAGDDHGKWYVKGVSDTDRIVSILKNKLDADINAEVDTQRAKILAGSTSIKTTINKYGMSFISDSTAGLKMPKFTKVYGLVDEESTLTEDDVTCLVDNLVRYDEDAFVVEKVNTDYKSALNEITNKHYAINDGYDTVAKLVEGEDFSIDALEFDGNIFKNGERNYVNTFIYEDIHLASFINDLGLMDGGSGFILNGIEVVAKNKIKSNLIVEIEAVTTDNDFGVMQSLLPTRLSVTVPISFDSTDHGAWTIDGLGEQDKVVQILTQKLSVNLDSLISDKRNEFIASANENFEAHDMCFDVSGDVGGLQMPSVCQLYSKEKDGVSEADAIYLFDNLVCYEEVQHSIFTDEYTKEDAENEFMDIMSKYYRIKDTYSGNAIYVDENGTETSVVVTDIPVTYDIVLASFGFYIDGYVGYEIGTKYLMNLDMSLLEDEQAMATLCNDVLIRNEIVTLWIETAGKSEGFELEKIQVVGNDKISFTGFINMSDHLGENVCQTAKSLMCDKLNVTMQVNLSDGSLIDYYIEDLVGDVENNYENVDDDHEKSKKLVEIIQKLDDSLEINDETFASYASDVSLLVNDMLDTIVGIDPYRAQLGDVTEQRASVVYYEDGTLPVELEDFGVNAGFLLPDGASYAYKNSREFRELFDWYYSEL